MKKSVIRMTENDLHTIIKESIMEMLKENVMAREELREYMNSIYDLERLTMKISYRSANPRDLIAFKTSLQYLSLIHI